MIPSNFREIQKKGYQHIMDNPRCGLFFDMGLGKTATTLYATKQLLDEGKITGALIVAPKSVAAGTWQEEMRNPMWPHLHSLRYSEITGTPKKREKAASDPNYDIYIIGRDNLWWLLNFYATSKTKVPFNMLILDESSSFKSHNTNRTKAAAKFGKYMKYVVELTGTPAPKDLSDLWSQVTILDFGKRLGKNITAFRNTYMYPLPNNFGYKMKPGVGPVIHKLIEDICLSAKTEDYVDLPEMIESDVIVVLDEKAQKLYEKMEKEEILKLEDQEITALNSAALRIKLLQLCQGICYNNSEERIPVHVHDCKFEAFQELVEGLNGEHALVFYHFKHDMDRILEAYSKSNLVVRKFTDEQDKVDWNNGKIDILLAHPASAAFGLNLQRGGHHIIWYGLTDNLEHYQQANKRLHRSGQEYPVIVHRLIVKGGMDEDVIAGIQAKADGQEALMQALSDRIRRVRSE